MSVPFPNSKHTNVTIIPRKPRKKFSQRLKELGILQCDFELYRKAFVVKYGDYFRLTERGWRPGRRPPFLTKYIVIKHLQHECMIARVALDEMNYFCIDIDNKTSEISLKERYDKIREAFRCPLVVRSSSSGGLHLYYLFKKRMEKGELALKIKTILKMAGITVKRGLIEIFPGLISQLRLPMGLGSCILDPETLEPLDMDLSQQLSYLRHHLEYRRLDLLKLFKEQKLKNEISKPPPEEVKSNREPKKEPIKLPHIVYRDLNTHPPHIQHILDAPLEYGTRHDTMMKLVSYLMHRGLDDLQIENFINDYLSKLGHKSKDLEDYPEIVKRDVKGLIKNFRGKFKKGIRSMVSITKTEILFILEATKQLMTNDRYGHEAFAMQKFMFDLLTFYKQMGTDNLSLSYTSLRRMKGSSKKRIKRQLDFLIDNEILKITQEHSRTKHTCRRYQLNYQFFTEGEDVKSLEESLKTLYDKSELYKMYSPQMFHRVFPKLILQPLNQIEEVDI